MLRDRRGLTVTANSPAAAALLDATVAAFAGHRAETGALLARTLAADPDLLLAHCLRGFSLKLLARRELDHDAEAALALARVALRRSGATPREARYIAALDAWCGGDMQRSARILETIVKDHLLDLLGVKLHHAVNFMLGDLRAMRETALAVAPPWQEGGVPDAGFVLGCLAFALEESGDYARAETAGTAACALNPEDAWAIHAVAHVFLMRGEPQAGLAWLTRNEANLAGCNNFAYHVAWHEALFHLELGAPDAALDLYDRRVRAVETDDFRDIANAASLLWRLERIGVAVGDRWGELAAKAAARVGDLSLVFARLHDLLALAGAGRIATAEMMLRAMRLHAARQPGTQSRTLGEIGLVLGTAIIAAQRGRHGQVVDLLFPVRDRIRRIGGSHAQREIFLQGLTDAAIRAGRHGEAAILLAERLRQRPQDAGAARQRSELARSGETGALASSLQA
jgi:tetratricopeptide (TPR) repeat protein